MSTRLFIALVALVVFPLLLLGWLSTSAIRDQAERTRQSLQAVFQQRLLIFANNCQTTLEELRDEVQQGLSQTRPTTDTLGDLRRNSAIVSATFWLDSSGSLLYPEIPDRIDSTKIEEFLAIDELIPLRPQSAASDRASTLRNVTLEQLASPATKAASPGRAELTPQWMPWYWQQGLQLVLWIPTEQGEVYGVLLNRPAWMSRIISGLPDSIAGDPPAYALPSVASSPLTRIRLIDGQGTTLYQWGTGLESAAPEADWYSLAELPLDGPLATWKFQYESDHPLSPTSGSTLPLVLGLVALGLLMTSLGIYVTTHLQRQMQLAAQQVSFAGQVSHELRTPLTNIRLYAEMAQDELATVTEQSPDDPQILKSIGKRLGVIEQETERLSRLCDSVLELVRRPHQPQHNALAPSVDIRQIVTHMIDQFRPAFEGLGLELQVENGVVEPLAVDRAAFEMTLMNLLSNVEKYAASGKWCQVRVWREKSSICLSVADRGTGIPRGKREKIFRPFYRLNSAITAPTGTGIGLAIARQAVQRGGGSLKLVASDVGACFEMRLPCR